jgi:hypothetical protein
VIRPTIKGPGEPVGLRALAGMLEPGKISKIASELVEHRTENPRVGGSIPPLGTNFF